MAVDRWSEDAVPARKRIRAALASNAMGLGITLVFQVVSVPLLLASLGLQDYGTWLILTAIPAYLTLANFGISLAAATYATRCVVDGETSKANVVLTSAWAGISAISVFVSAAILALCHFSFPPSGVVTASKDEALLVVGLQLAWFFFYIQAGFCEAAFRSNGTQARGVMWINALRLADLLALITGFAIGADIVAIAVLLLLVRAATTTAVFIDAFRVVTWWRPSVTDWKPDVFRSIAKPSLGHMGFSLGAAISGQGMVLVVGWQFGSSEVVAFVTVRTIAGVVRQAISVPDRSLTPELTAAIARGSSSRVRSVIRLLVWLSACGAVVATAVLAIVGPRVVDVWTAGEVEVSRVFVTLMLLTVLADIPWLTGASLLTSVNAHYRLSVAFVWGSTAAVAAAASLAPILGINCVPLALFVVDVITTPVSFYDSRKILRSLR